MDAVEHLDEEQDPLPPHDVGHSQVHLRVEICFYGFKLDCSGTPTPKGKSAEDQDLLGQGGHAELEAPDDGVGRRVPFERVLQLQGGAGEVCHWSVDADRDGDLVLLLGEVQLCNSLNM